jgi:hypothetical protein
VNRFYDRVDGPGAAAAKDVEVVTDAEVSSFDDAADPPYVTVKPGLRRFVRLRLGVRPARIESSKPSVATARLVKGDDFTVEITGHAMGTAVLAAAVPPPPKWEAAVAYIGLAQLDVDVPGPLVTYLDFHFVTDAKGRTTTRTAANVRADLLPEARRLFGAANIDVQLHNHRAITVSDLDFTTPNQTRDQVVALLDALTERSKKFDAAPYHIHVWCVPEWAAKDVAGGAPGTDRDEVGTSRGRLIVLEDKQNKATPGSILAHELGHSWGLAHNNGSARNLMHEHQAGRGGTKLYRDEYRKIIRLK